MDATNWRIRANISILFDSRVQLHEQRISSRVQFRLKERGRPTSRIMSVAVTVVQVQAMDGDGVSGRVGESGRVRERERTTAGKPVVTNKAYRRDKSIVPRLYATNPRYNVLSRAPSPHFPPSLASRARRHDVPRYPPPWPANPTPAAVTFYYTVPIPGSVAAKQPAK